MLISTDLVDITPTYKLYQDSAEFYKNNTCLLYGFEVKNLYDESRLLIAPELKPVRIRHNTRDDGFLINRFFYGVILQGNTVFKKLSKELLNYTLNPNSEFHIIDYKLLLSDFNLSVNNSFKHYTLGAFPLDDIKQLTDDCNLINNYEKFYYNNDVPYFQKISNITPYIISKTIL